MPRFSFGKILINSTGETDYLARVKINKVGSNTAVKLWLGKPFIDAAEMEGKIIEFLADPSKRALAWRVLDKVNQAELSKHTMKIVKVNTSGYCQIGITRIVESIKVPIAEYVCPIKQYDDDVYNKDFYIELNEETKRL